MLSKFLDGLRSRHNAERKDVHALHTGFQTTIVSTFDHLFLERIDRHTIARATVGYDNSIKATAIRPETVSVRILVPKSLHPQCE